MIGTNIVIKAAVYNGIPEVSEVVSSQILYVNDSKALIVG